MSCDGLFFIKQNLRFGLVGGGWDHGLRTPNEGINQRNLKIWANVADKICLGHT